MKEDEVIDPVFGRANVVCSQDGHHGVCDTSEGKAGAGSAKGCGMVDVA